MADSTIFHPRILSILLHSGVLGQVAGILLTRLSVCLTLRTFKVTIIIITEVYMTSVPLVINAPSAEMISHSQLCMVGSLATLAEFRSKGRDRVLV